MEKEQNQHRNRIREAIRQAGIHIIHSESYQSDDNHYSVYNADDLAALVYDSINYYQNQAQQANERANRTENEVKQSIQQEYEDEINRLKQKLELSYGHFNSEQEKQAYYDFCKMHNSCRTANKINLGRKPYIISNNNGIGIQYIVVCPICGTSKDITDTEVW